MAIVRTPFAARVRFVRTVGDMNESVQTFSRLNPNLTQANLDTLRIALNFARPPLLPATRGYFTVTEELTEA
ncbi:MAG: hypothetical protein FWC70_11085 [Defluviitaleaceae bacterium]|nr:hypothetical protein [Defluviitaleaceae bacterium]